jgi:hypothetical protein
MYGGCGYGNMPYLSSNMTSHGGWCVYYCVCACIWIGFAFIVVQTRFFPLSFLYLSSRAIRHVVFFSKIGSAYGLNSLV